MFEIRPPTVGAFATRHQHSNNLRHILRTALLRLDTDDALQREHNHRLAFESAKALLRQASKRFARGRPRDAVSSEFFQLMWTVGTELLRSRVPFRADLENADADENGGAESFRLRGQGATAVDGGQVDPHAVTEGVQFARRLLRFLGQMASVEAKLSAELLREMTLYYMRFGMYDEAYNRLQGYISSYPYNENAALVGYAGLLSYLLWRKEAARMRDEHDDVEGSFGGSQWSLQPSQDSYGWSQRSFDGLAENSDSQRPAEGDLASRHYSDAIQHLELSLYLDSSNDMFLFLHLKLILAAGDEETAKEKLFKFIEDNPNNPNGYRYLLQLHHTLFKGPPAEWVPLAYTLLRIDPVCDARIAIIPLVKFHEANHLDEGLKDEERSIQSSISILRLLGDRLDYEQGNAWMWKKLAEHLCLLREKNVAFEDEHWLERPQWWPSFHFPWRATRASPPSSPVSPELEEYVVAKAVCAQYLFPAQYAEFGWPARHGLLTPDALRPSSSALLQRHAIPASALFETATRRIPDCFNFSARGADAPVSRVDSVHVRAQDVDDVVRMLEGNHDAEREDSAKAEGSAEEAHGQQASALQLGDDMVDAILGGKGGGLLSSSYLMEGMGKEVWDHGLSRTASPATSARTTQEMEGFHALDENDKSDDGSEGDVDVDDDYDDIRDDSDVDSDNDQELYGDAPTHAQAATNNNAYTSGSNPSSPTAALASTDITNNAPSPQKPHSPMRDANHAAATPAPMSAPRPSKRKRGDATDDDDDDDDGAKGKGGYPELLPLAAQQPQATVESAVVTRAQERPVKKKVKRLGGF